VAVSGDANICGHCARTSRGELPNIALVHRRTQALAELRLCDGCRKYDSTVWRVFAPPRGPRAPA
jgi:hypothetical protein